MSNENSFPIPPSITLFIARVKTLVASMSRPVKMVVVTTLVLALAIGSVVTFNGTHETYATLFTQLERDDAAALVAKLKEMKVPYRIEADGTTISVPEERVHELRLELASAGLPRGGGVGFESFDKMRLGATDFEQRVLYRRALEGELARTVGTLGSVLSARVHLVMPERSVFIARSEPASASLMLRLRPGRAIGPSEVAGIVHLTASSVPGLTADRIAVVTTDGVMLHRPHGNAAGGTGTDEASDEGAENMPRARAIEAALEDRARAMLEKVVGPGHVDVRVTAEIDLARTERVEDRYDPSHAVLRSEEMSIDRNGLANDATLAGIPGAESNVPSGAAAAAAVASAAASASVDGGAPKAIPAKSDALRETHTRNFEIDHVSEKRIMMGGAVRRIAVAVIVDGIPKTGAPRSKEEIDKLAALVRSSVGANDARGDIVTVDSIPFLEGAIEAPVVAAVAQEPKWKKYAPAAGAGGLLIAIGLVTWVRGRRQRAKQKKAAEQLQLSSASSSAFPQIEPASESPTDLRAAALERARRDPATAALVLRFWLGTSATDVKQDGKGDVKTLSATSSTSSSVAA